MWLLIIDIETVKHSCRRQTVRCFAMFTDVYISAPTRNSPYGVGFFKNRNVQIHQDKNKINKYSKRT